MCPRLLFLAYRLLSSCSCSHGALPIYESVSKFPLVIQKKIHHSTFLMVHMSSQISFLDTSHIGIGPPIIMNF